MKLPKTAFLLLGMALVVSATLLAQTTQPTIELRFGNTQSVVAKTFGKPFERWNLTTAEHSAALGMPTGTYIVYHLTTGQDRMYVTMIHFSSPGATGEIDCLMLEANGHWTVLQMMDDQPELADICKKTCDVVKTKDEAGNDAILLQQHDSAAAEAVFFEGDSAERPEWRSVGSLSGIPSWVYVLPEFKKHHPDFKGELIGKWAPHLSPGA